MSGSHPIRAVAESGAAVRLGEGESEARLLLLEQQLDRDAGALDDAIFAARQAIEPHEGEAPAETRSATAPPGTFVSMRRRHPTIIFSAAATVLVVLVIPLALSGGVLRGSSLCP